MKVWILLLVEHTGFNSPSSSFSMFYQALSQTTRALQCISHSIHGDRGSGAQVLWARWNSKSHLPQQRKPWFLRRWRQSLCNLIRRPWNKSMLSPTTDPTASAIHCNQHKYRELGRTLQSSAMTNRFQWQPVNALKGFASTTHTCSARAQVVSTPADCLSLHIFHLRLSCIFASKLSKIKHVFAVGLLSLENLCHKFSRNLSGTVLHPES